MSASLAYAGLLKRVPQQARSVSRVEAILDAASELLVDHPPAALTVRDVAARAGVPTGTLYQFFEDLDAVFQALALRYVDGLPSFLDAAASVSGGWEAVVDAVVDAYAGMVRSAPAIRSLWLSGELSTATRTAEAQSDAAIAASLGTELHRRALGEISSARTGEPHQWALLVAIIDAVLHQAFADSATGDARILAEGRVAARAYAAAVLGIA